MVLLFSPSIYRFPGCLYCISKNLGTARRLLGEYILIGDEPKRNHLRSPFRWGLCRDTVRVHLMLSRGVSLARPVLSLALFTKPQETHRIVVKDVAFLRLG